MLTMGTGIILNQRTRSQNRKTKSASIAAVKYGVTSSPLEVVHGNHIAPAFTRQAMQTRNSSTTDTSCEKENAPPLPTEALLCVGSKVPKRRKDRKNSGAAARDSKRLCTSSKDTEDKNGTNFASLPVNGTGFNTRSNNACGLAYARINFQANLGTDDGEREASVDCEVSNRHEIPTAPGASAGLENNERGALPITEFGQRVEGAIPSTSLLIMLEKDYEKVYGKYQKLKASRFAEIDARFEGQNSRITAYVNATEALVEQYKGENCHLRQQFQESNIPELLSRSKSLEKTNLEHRNDLILERSKTLELQQEIKRLKSLLSKDNVNRSKSTELDPDLSLVECMGFAIDTRKSLSRQCKSMHQLLEYLVGLKLSLSAEGVVEFQHGPTGFKFSLRSVHDMDIAELVGGGELVYQNVSLGTLFRKATGWIKEEEAIFGMAQARLLFKALHRLLQRGA